MRRWSIGGAKGPPCRVRMRGKDMDAGVRSGERCVCGRASGSGRGDDIMPCQKIPSDHRGVPVSPLSLAGWVRRDTVDDCCAAPHTHNLFPSRAPFATLLSPFVFLPSLLCASIGAAT